ncbi:MAG: hypothetical protein EAZ11_11605 [Curvibacter sp.]|nr:MAG: hypothetical protein EAZ11_11605 [Curvibacter sp.]
MNQSMFDRFGSAIRNFSGAPDSPDLLIAKESNIACYYAPFDIINPDAKIVLVGITPGRTQAVNSLVEAQRQLKLGATPEAAMHKAKSTGAFSGAMRSNLTSLLDHIGLQRWLDIGSCNELFGGASHLMQSTSVLQFPVFVSGENYNGTPDPTVSPLLRQMLIEHFVPVVKALPNAAFVPLGPVPTKVMQWLLETGHVSKVQLIQGLPHPSGANAERIQYFLGKKDVSLLSTKTDPIKLDAARQSLRAAVAGLR